MDRKILAALLALALSAGAHAESSRMQVAFAEKANIAASTGVVAFDAYGRRFTLNLENNDRLVRGLSVAQKASLSPVRLLRGTVAGAPGSWVRLTRIGSQVTGAFWDGTDLYLVGRHDSVAPFLTNPLEAAPGDTVVFRLSDTENLLPPDFCATRGLKPMSSNGLAQYKALINELKLQFVAAPTDQLDISLVADSALADQYAHDSPPYNDVRYAMLNTMNLVDGIYDAQLGLMISASELHVVSAGSDPFTATDSSQLLEQLATYRAGIPALNSKPISHLFTHQFLDGGVTLGIARLGGACDVTNGVSLTSVGFSGLQYDATFIMAHELGHNLNAQHDTASCGNTHIMWPEYGGAMDGRFSQCSINQIKPFIEQHRGSCFISPMYGDVEPRIGSIADPLRTEPFVWPVYVRSAGTAPLTGAVLYIDLRAANLDTITPAQGTCAPSNGTIRCQLGTIAAGAEVRIDLGITANQYGAVNLQLNADSANDRYENNNLVSGSVQVQPPATLALSVSPQSVDALVGDLVPITYTITASGPRASRDVGINTFTGGFLQFVSATSTQGVCSLDSCVLGDLPGGSSAQVTFLVRPQQGGALSITAQLDTSNARRPDFGVSATVNATATLDLAIGPQPALQLVAVGVPFDIVIPVRANGTKSVTGGKFRMVSGATVLSADISGTPCALSDLQSAYGGGCDLGTLNPGDELTVTVRVLFDVPYQTNVYLAAEIQNDELWSNNTATVLFQARYATDVSLDMFPNSFGQLEDLEFSVAATLQSQGVEDASNVTATLDVPVGMRIVSAALPGGTCTATGVRRIACTLGLLARGAAPQMTVRMVGDEPASYVAVWTIEAANDGVPANNTMDVNVRINPRADVGVRLVGQVPGLIVGQSREFTVEVFTGSERPVDNVDITFPGSGQFMELEAIATNVGTCVLGGTSAHCNLGTLAPNTVVQMTPRYRALQNNWGSATSINASAAYDFNHDNDYLSINLNGYEAGDTSVRVASTTISGTVGSTIVLPTITVDSGTARANGVYIDIPLPAFATVETISGSGVCVGGSPMQCWLGDKEPNTVNEISITLKLNSTGTFTSNVLVHAGNDTNSANNSASLQVRSNAVVTNPPSGGGGGNNGGGGGGGGSFEWLSLGLVGLLAAWRLRAASRFSPLKTAPRHGFVVLRQRIVMSRKKTCGLRH